MFMFLKRIFFFMGTLSIFYVLFVSLISTFIDGSETQYRVRKYTNIPLGAARRGASTFMCFQEIQEFKDIDVLFVGSSHCYRSFDPRFFQSRGMHVFNMGSTSQSPLNSYYLLQQYLSDLSPEVVVLELYWAVMKQDGTESTLDLLTNIPSNQNMIKMTFATKNIRAINGLLSTWLNFRLTPLAKLSPNLLAVDRYIAGGFVETVRKGSSNPDDEFQPYEITINPAQLNYLQKIIETLKMKRIHVVLVTTPVSDRYFNSIVNYDDWKQTIMESTENYDVEFIDFNDCKHLTASELFYDKDHLNSDGVRAFNEEFYRRVIVTKNKCVQRGENRVILFQRD